MTPTVHTRTHMLSISFSIINNIKYNNNSIITIDEPGKYVSLRVCKQKKKTVMLYNLLVTLIIVIISIFKDKSYIIYTILYKSIQFNANYNIYKKKTSSLKM